MAKKKPAMEGPYFTHGIGQSVESFEKEHGGKAVYSNWKDPFGSDNRSFHLRKK
jgi:hypothetical protein